MGGSLKAPSPSCMGILPGVPACHTVNSQKYLGRKQNVVSGLGSGTSVPPVAQYRYGVNEGRHSTVTNHCLHHHLPSTTTKVSQQSWYVLAGVGNFFHLHRWFLILPSPPGMSGSWVWGICTSLLPPSWGCSWEMP